MPDDFTAPEPEPFSPASAQLAAEELFDAIPKSRRMEHMGAYNEVLVVIERATHGVDPMKAL